MTRIANARATFGARTKTEARKTAHHIVAAFVQSYFDEGQPFVQAGEDNIPDADAQRLEDALSDIQEQHIRRSGR